MATLSPMEPAPKKILILLLGAIGDVTRALPVAVRIKRAWPDAELHWAVEPISKSIVEDHPAIDEVKLFDRPKGFPAFLSFVREIRSENYELVLDMQRHFKSGVSSWSTRAPRRLSFNRKNSREGNWLFNTEQVAESEHYSSKTLQFQNFGDALKLPSLEPLEFDLSPNDVERQQLQDLLKEIDPQCNPSQRYVSFILGSTWPSRFWTAEAYAQLALELSSAYSCRALLLGADGEKEFAESILSIAGPRVALNLVGKTKLRELVPVFALSECAVGSDSGPMHIATAVGCPVISLWGSTSPKRSAPYGSESLVLQSAIGCSPCYRKRCPGLDTECMKDIPWQAVFARVKALISPAITNT